MKKSIPFILLTCLILLWMPPANARNEPEGFYRNSYGMTFARIPAGTFLMGSETDERHRDDDEKLHRVDITRPFYIQTKEVSLSQWWEIMGKKVFGRRSGPGNLPVTDVSWFDCRGFIEKLNQRENGTYRLPTEAEWEYACRAGSQSPFPWGESISCKDALYGNNTLKTSTCVEPVQDRGWMINRPAPVGRFPANPWGLHDMPGNVWEWCADWYGAYPAGPSIDPRGPESGRYKVRRGGSWYGAGHLCRSANRNFGHAADRYRTTGFRLVLELDE